jgi:glycerol-3-phosphate dehydrogenase
VIERRPDALAASRENIRYLPGVTLAPQIVVTADLAVAARASVLLAAVRLPRFPR